MIRISIILILSALLLSNCSTDFDVTADPEEKAVVFGMISQNDSIHYVRIQRTYLVEGNALDAAQIADSIYFNDNITVTITELNSNQTSTLTRIDASTVGLDKDPGVFASDPAYLYTYQRNYNNGDSILLRVRKENTGEEWIAQVPIVQDFNILVNPTTRISLVSTNPYRLNWRSAKGGRTYDLVFRINYLEWDISDPINKVPYFVDWNVFTGISSSHSRGGEPLQEDIEGSGFFTALRSGIEVDNDKRRKIDSTKGIELLMYAGGSEIYNFNRVRDAQLGLLANEFLPSYTNIENGLGIFASRYLQKESGILLTRSTVDSIACSVITRELNFINNKGELGCD